MGCCGSAGVQDLSEAQRRDVYDICVTALISPKPSKLIEFAVDLYKKSGKDEQFVYNALRTEERKLGMYTNKPPELEGSKSMAQLTEHIEKQARLFTSKQYGHQYRSDKKLGIGSDDELKAFVQKVVAVSFQSALLERVKEVFNPEYAHGEDGADADPHENLRATGGGGGASRAGSQSGSGLQSSQSSSALKKEPSAAVAPAATKKGGGSNEPLESTGKKSGTSNGTDGSTKKTATTTVAANGATAKSNAGSGSKSTAAAEATSPKKAKPQPKVIRAVGSPPKRTPYTDWEETGDSEYYWSSTARAYYDDVQKSFYNFETEKWQESCP